MKIFLKVSELIKFCEYNRLFIVINKEDYIIILNNY